MGIPEPLQETKVTAKQFTFLQITLRNCCIEKALSLFSLAEASSVSLSFALASHPAYSLSKEYCPPGIKKHRDPFKIKKKLKISS